MAFKARIVDVSRAVTQINITVLFFDEATGWEFQDILGFQDGDVLTWAIIQAEAQARGSRYKAALARETTIRSNIGSEMVI